MLLGDMEANRPNNQLKEEKVLISKEGRMGKRRDKGPLFFIINTGFLKLNACITLIKFNSKNRKRTE